MEQEELTSEKERCMQFLEKVNQKWGQEKMAERFMVHESNVTRRGVDHTEERRRRNTADIPPPSIRGNGAGASSSGEEENKDSLSGMAATVLLDDGREVEIPVEYLSAELVPRTMGERQLLHRLNHQMNQKLKLKGQNVKTVMLI